MTAYDKATAKMSPFQLDEMLVRVGRPSLTHREEQQRPSRFASIALALAASTSSVLACAAIFNP